MRPALRAPIRPPLGAVMGGLRVVCALTPGAGSSGSNRTEDHKTHSADDGDVQEHLDHPARRGVLELLRRLTNAGLPEDTDCTVESERCPN